MAFNLIASCYDILSNPEGRIAQERPLFKDLVRPGDTVLDLACGTGPQALCIAQDCGGIVDAGDLSDEMIEYAKAKRPHAHISYAVRDMSTPPPGPYNLILCVGNSLNLLPDRTQVRRTIEQSLASLAPNGALLLHLINPEAPQHQKTKHLQKSAVVDGVSISIDKTLTPHAQGRSLCITYRPSEGQVIEEKAELLDITKDEIVSLIQELSSASVTVYGTLGRDTFKPDSPDILVLIR